MKVLVLILLSLVIVISGCIAPQEVPEEEVAEETPTEVPPIENVAAPLAPTTPSECGDRSCRDVERCDEDTLTTACPQDCGYTCPASIILHKIEGTTMTDLNSYYCGDNKCLQPDENDFTINGDTTIRTRVTNVGEIFSSQFISNFNCQKVNSAVSASRDDQILAGLIISDSFDGKETTTLNGKHFDGDSAEYMLDLNYDSVTVGFDMYCYITIRSDEITNQQGINIRVNQMQA